MRISASTISAVMNYRHYPHDFMILKVMYFLSKLFQIKELDAVFFERLRCSVEHLDLSKTDWIQVNC